MSKNFPLSKTLKIIKIILIIYAKEIGILFGNGLDSHKTIFRIT